MTLKWENHDLSFQLKSCTRSIFAMGQRKMFPIIQIPDDAPIIYEQLGTKKKFWMDENRFLFKEVREGTGEDWAEKIVCEISNLIGIPHAKYDLAVWKGKRGVRSENFALPQESRRLILGNELLVKLDPRYPGKEIRRVRQHTVRKVLKICSWKDLSIPIGFQPINGIQSAAEVFLGYLMLDAWVANQDRHHENWGIILQLSPKTFHLAPSFDHASSLAPFELDSARQERLLTKDRGRSLEKYIERASSAFYRSEGSTKPLSTLDAFLMASKPRLLAAAALSWLKRLENIAMNDIDAIFEKVPSVIMSDISKKFARKLLELNRDRLLGCVDKILS